MPIVKKKIITALICLSGEITGLIFFTGCASLAKLTSPVRETGYRQIITRQIESDNWNTRLNAIQEVSRYVKDDKGFAESILLKASADPHRLVVIESMKGLSAINTPESERRIIEIYTTTKDTDIRWYSLKALVPFRNQANAPIFAESMESPDWLHRETAIRGILLIRDLNEQYRRMDLIIKAINDSNGSVAMETLLNLEIRDDRLYAVIVDRLHAVKESDNSMLIALLSALRGYLLDSKTREKVINYLVHPNGKVRVEAYRVLKTEQEIIKSRRKN